MVIFFSIYRVEHTSISLNIKKDVYNDIDNAMVNSY